MMNDSLKAFLMTGRLELKILSEDDRDFIFELRSSPEVSEYLDRETYTSVDDAFGFIERIKQQILENKCIYWVIYLGSEERAGTICLWNYSIEHSMAHIGYEMLTRYQGMGIMGEAMDSVLKYAFEVMKLREIVAVTNSKNMSSIRLLESRKFKCCGNNKGSEGFLCYKILL